MDNTFTEQASITQFIEDNWDLGRVGNQSADAAAGTLDNAFDFSSNASRAPAVILDDKTGEVDQVIGSHSVDRPAAVAPAAVAPATRAATETRWRRQPGGHGNPGGSGSGSGSGSGHGSSTGSGHGSSSGSSHGSSGSSHGSKPSKVTCHQSSSHRTITLTASRARTLRR